MQFPTRSQDSSYIKVNSATTQYHDLKSYQEPLNMSCISVTTLYSRQSQTLQSIHEFVIFLWKFIC